MEKMKLPSIDRHRFVIYRCTFRLVRLKTIITYDFIIADFKALEAVKPWLDVQETIEMQYHGKYQIYVM
jgi:hypothetical protein